MKYITREELSAMTPAQRLALRANALKEVATAQSAAVTSMRALCAALKAFRNKLPADMVVASGAEHRHR